MMRELFNVRIGEIAKIQNGYAFKSKEYVESGLRVIRIANVQTGEIIDRDPKFYPIDRKDEFDEYLIEDDDFLISLTGNVGRVGRINKELLPALLNQRVGKFTFLSNLVLKDFLFYYLNSRSFVNQVIKSSKGVAQLNTSTKKIEDIEFSIFSLPEQRAIVSKIENLFSDLDNGIADLKKAQEQLKIYRQAVLKKAFERELTKEWREKQESSILEKWQQVKLNEICEHITDGDHQAPPKSDVGIPFITISNIDKSNNKIDFSNTFFVLEEYFRNLNLKRVPQIGDILFTVTGSFGIPVMIDFEKDFCFQRHIGLIRPKSYINQKWLYHLLQTQLVYRQASEKATGTAQKTVALSTLRNIQIPLCSKEEQHQIVREIESRLSVCDKVEQNITEALNKSEALRQSILKKAFEGKLLSAAEIAQCKQEADYEPASVLLEKLKQSRRDEKIITKKQVSKTIPKG